MEKIKLFFHHKYIKLLLLLVLLVISYRPVIFTWNFIKANSLLKQDNFKAGAYIGKVISIKPSVLKLFNQYAPGVVEKYLVKSAIRNNSRDVLSTFSSLIPLQRIRNQFKDNFYLRELLGNEGLTGDYDNLDEVSFDLLSDPLMNTPTVKGLERNYSILPQSFFSNLADFAFWQNNKELINQLLAAGMIKDSPFKSVNVNGLSCRESISRLMFFLKQTYFLKSDELGENLLPCSDFSEKNCFATNWYFSKMAGVKNFSRGSFFMGIDYAGKENNSVIRVMGFFAATDPGKTKARAGIRSRKNINAENGFYIFSFDYCTVSGNESASFWLGKKIEKRLPHTQKQWKKVVFIVNNAFNQFETLNPFIRMWGTGTLLVDNVFLAKTKPLKFSIDKVYEFHITKIRKE